MRQWPDNYTTEIMIINEINVDTIGITLIVRNLDWYSFLLCYR